MEEKMKKEIFMSLISAVIGIVIGALFVYFFLPNKGGNLNLLSPQKAAEKALNYLNENILQPQGISASLNNVLEENGLYKLQAKIQNQDYNLYVTKNGSLLFVQAFDLNATSSSDSESNKNEQPAKNDKPDVKLFVMSYCPYGLQMEKAFLPVYDLLKEKANMEIYFVDYIMHGKQEIDENLRQYCIQKEQKEKYPAYLNCFLKAGEFEKCLNEIGIDQSKMNSCIAETDKNYKITELYNDKNTWLSGSYPQFNVYKELNDKYGVQGSPTLVINDKVINADRTPQGLKEVICQSFNNPPQECSKELSKTVFSPGFGFQEGSNNSGGCGQ